MKDGIININKPAGMTSHDVIYHLRKILGVKKMGHTGTLDPMATGVLPICIGKATRVAEYMDMDFKKYRCTMMLGMMTDTQDITGEIWSTRSTEGVTVKAVKDAFEKFHGVIDQKPPMYSAVRINGRRLYEYARAGEEIEVKTRQIYIKSLNIDSIDFAHDSDCKKVTFTVECSKGTYIRTICQDVGEALGCGAVMESLERLASGRFVIEEAVTLDELKEVADRAGLSPDRKFGEEIPEVFEKYVLGVDFPLCHFGSVLMSKECGDKFIDGWHISYKECMVEEEPEYMTREPEFRIRDEYRRAYKMYAEDSEEQNPDTDGKRAPGADGKGLSGADGKRLSGADGKRVFLGVAFHSDKYKKLVADKVFARSEKS